MIGLALFAGAMPASAATAPDEALLDRMIAGLLAPDAPATPVVPDTAVAPDTAAVSANTPPDLFGLTAVPLGESIYDRIWREASTSALPAGNADVEGEIARLEALPLRERAAAANAWINARIPYAPDPTLSKHWGTLARGLARGGGEHEDIAIAKLQLLAACGTPRRDMFMVLVRDWAREADDALLVVRDAGEVYVLDSRRDAPLGSGHSDRYFPVVALNVDGAWVFGRRTAGAASSDLATLASAGR